MNSRTDLAFTNANLALSYDLTSAAFQLARPGVDRPALVHAQARVSLRTQTGRKLTLGADLPVRLTGQRELSDAHGTGMQLEFCLESGAFALTQWFNLYDDRPFMLTRLAVSNGTREPVQVDDFMLLDCTRRSGGELRLTDTREPLDVLKVGWHDWVYTGLRHANQREVGTRLGYYIGQMLFNPTAPVLRGRGKFYSDGWTVVADRRSALVAGLASTADQFGLLQVNAQPGESGISLVSQADGVRLEPGETLESEWGYLQFVDLPHHDPPEEYARAVARQMRARVPAVPPPPKWTHWYHYFQDISHERFVDNLETVERLREHIPFGTVQLDDGYQSAWGDWDTSNSKFPKGLGHLAAQIGEKGFDAGVWFAPFAVDPKARVALEHPEWLLRDRRGKPIRSGYFYQFFGYALDATRPEVLDHLYNLAHTIRHEWGFRFIKADFSYAAALPAVRHDPKATRAQALRRGYETIRRAIGDDAFFLGCGCPFGPAIGVVDAMRIGPDTAPSYSPFLWNLRWAGPLLRDEQSVASLRNNMRHTLNLSTLHRRWWWNDPDCLMVRDYDTALTEAEIAANLTLVGLHGGLVINSDDLKRLSPARVRMLSLLVPILSPGARPLDLLEREMPEFYHLPVDMGWGHWDLIAVFNWSDRALPRTLPLARLGLDRAQRYHVFDFWNETYLRHKGSEIALEPIPPHGVRLLRVAPLEDRPAIVGDTFHITQGMEIESARVDDTIFEIAVAALGRRARGKLVYHLPSPPAGAALNDEPLSIHPIAPDIYAVAVDAPTPARLKISIK